MNTKRLPEMVLEQLKAQGCISPGQVLCCGLSGGADSVCLLRCLVELAPTLSCTVTAVHVNHQLRGEESLRDQAFCEHLCKSLSVPLTVCTVDVRAYATAHHCSEELAARVCRYEAFATLPADWLITAHTASDNLETFVHRLVRGSGLHGLCAIPKRNGKVLRPLLSVTRAQVEAYLDTLGQPYVTDSTNLTDRYTRNRIRHKILPEMQSLNPSVERTISHTITALQRDEDYLTQQAEQAYALCHTENLGLTGLSALHPAMGIRCVAKLLEEYHLSYDAPLLERLWNLTRTGGKWSLTRTMEVICTPGTLYLCPTPPLLQPEIPLQLGENQLYDGWVLRATLLENENCVKIENVQKKFANCLVDYDKIKGDMFLCGRQPGQKMQLPGREFSSPLKKLVQAKVPPHRRKTVHLLKDDTGVVYAEYVGAAGSVSVDKTTRRFLRLEVEEKRK